MQVQGVNIENMLVDNQPPTLTDGVPTCLNDRIKIY